MAAASQARAPFSWRELQARQPGASARIFAAAATFGWIDGFLIPIRYDASPERLGIVSLAMTAQVVDDPVERGYLVQIALLAFERAAEIARETNAVVLSSREQEVMGLVARGSSDPEIAVALGLANATARFHVEQAKRKLGAKSRAQAVALAVSRGLIV